MYLLGYLPSQNRIYLADKDVNLFSYSLAVSLIDYQTAVLKGDMERAKEILPTVPGDQRNRVARFLESQGSFSISFFFHSILLKISTRADLSKSHRHSVHLLLS
jgi:hypothetical protein